MVEENSKEERIRQQAYLIWLDEGRPAGREKEHWEQAEQIVSRKDELSKEDESGSSAAIGPIPGP